MAYEKFLEEFADTIEVAKERLTDDFNMANDSAWDSLAFITTIALVDNYFSVVIDADVLRNTNTFGELKKLIFNQAA
jgi:acyl carrier protein